MASPDHPDLVFRAYEASDLDEVRTLQSRLFPVQYDDGFYARLSNDNVFTVVCRDASQATHPLVGVAFARLVPPASFLEDVPSAYLMTVGVDEAYRRRGIGAFLLGEIERVLEAGSAAHALRLHVLCTNEAALQMYARAGFVVEARLADFYAFDEAAHDAYRLSKPIGSRRVSSLLERLGGLWTRLTMVCCMRDYEELVTGRDIV